MSAENRTVTLRASRLKILPQAIVLAAFLLPFLLLAIISGYALAGKHHVEPADLAIFCDFGNYTAYLHVFFSAHTSSIS